MDKYFTIMLVPERNRGVRSIRLPGFLFRALLVIMVVSAMVLVILGYDYWNILQQVYENKHLALENRQLKEQIQLFQMKLNTLTDDIERIQTFEKKLRIITGIEGREHLTQDYFQNNPTKLEVDSPPDTKKFREEHPAQTNATLEEVESNPRFLKLQKMYEQKIAGALGFKAGYHYTKEWSDLTRKSLTLATQYATFDYHFQKTLQKTQNTETQVHDLDQRLLDEQSILRSTPTLLPSSGWITSYYGPRKSPYSGYMKFHEGLDVGAPTGAPIYAPADGLVTFSGTKAGFGNVLQIDHGYGIETIYAHAAALSVKKGMRVGRGDLVAKVGNTGNSTGPHLHYEIKVNGIPVDPVYFILD